MTLEKVNSFLLKLNENFDRLKKDIQSQLKKSKRQLIIFIYYKLISISPFFIY